ncbi:MAG: hypothetical protein GC204_09060 [Chloroflexi bacterium]|nr:hypothetical protein [Chloroflexota bacterium]
MNAEVKWENEAHSVLRCSFYGDWDWKVFYETVEQRLLFGEAHDPCLIVDVRGVTRIPIDVVLHLKRATQLARDIKGMIVLIATSTAVQTAYQVLMMVNRPLAEKLRLVASDEEAYAILQIPS